MPVTDDQLNAAAANCMGWNYDPGSPATMSVPMWRGDDDAGQIASTYCPASNLTQAWEFALAKSNDCGLSPSQARVRVGPSRTQYEYHDGTPQGAARALTICVLRANGVEA